MQEYELKQPSILGEKHSTYGYTFWSETGGDYPVMFNSQEGNIMPGTRVQAETAELKTSKNGKQYLRLKKVKFEDSPHPPVAFEDKPKATFVKATEQQNNKDQQITKNMVWKNLLQVYDVASMTPDSAQWAEFWSNVELHTEMLTNGNYDNLMSGSLSASSRATNDSDAVPTPSSSAAPSLGDTYRNRDKAVSYDDPPMEEG